MRGLKQLDAAGLLARLANPLARWGTAGRGGKHYAGVQPPEHKHDSLCAPIGEIHSAEFYIPTNNINGEPFKLLARAGDEVLAGQFINQVRENEKQYIAPTSGKLVAGGKVLISGRVPYYSECLKLVADGKNLASPRRDDKDYHVCSQDEILTRIKRAAIYGMGGGGFPAWRKLSSGNIKHLIVNAVECEPYITVDHALIDLYSDEIISAIALLQEIIDKYNIADQREPLQTHIAMEDNMLSAITKLRGALERSSLQETRIKVIPTTYPAGSEKQLVTMLMGQEIPAEQVTVQQGIICLNVATVRAIYRAVVYNEPLLRRLVTVAGNGVPQPRNYWVTIGTPLRAVLQQAGIAGVDDAGGANGENGAEGVDDAGGANGAEGADDIGGTTGENGAGGTDDAGGANGENGAEGVDGVEVFLGGGMMNYRVHDLNMPLSASNNCILVFNREGAAATGIANGAGNTGQTESSKSGRTNGGAGNSARTDTGPGNNGGAGSGTGGTRFSFYKMSEDSPPILDGRITDHRECIRCGLCEQVCPVKLLPQQLYTYIKADKFDLAEQDDVFSCIECAACDYVCPSGIPLSEYYTFAKEHIKAERVAKHKADRARDRFNDHKERIERQQQELKERRAARLAQMRSTNQESPAEQQEAKQRKLAALKMQIDKTQQAMDKWTKAGEAAKAASLGQVLDKLQQELKELDN